MSVVAVVAAATANSGEQQRLPVVVGRSRFQRAKRNFIFFEMSGLKNLRKGEVNRTNNRQRHEHYSRRSHQ
jgi:hypothetical protein